jgi:DNA-binding transcriptional ArsR family regulator
MSTGAVEWAKRRGGLSAPERAVLIALAWLADEAGEIERAPGRVVAERAGTSVRTVQRAAARLRDLHLLEFEGARKFGTRWRLLIGP